VNHRPTPLRAALDQLTHDFADAVLRAVRSAVLTNLAVLVPSAPPTYESSDAPRAPKTPSNPRAATARRAAPAAARTVDPVEAFPDDSVIIDPGLVLGFIDAHRDAKRAPSGPSDVGAEPIWEPKRATPARETEPTLDDAPESERLDAAPERAPVAAEARVVAPITRATSPSLRTGEEVLRTATGGLVLRRRSRTGER
jgi:hypothetical protein